MNTYLLCKEFEKNFGHFKKYNIKNRQTVVTRNIEFLSSPFSTFLYEISPYLEIDLSRLQKLLWSDCDRLFHCCSHVYRRFKKISVSMVLHHIKLVIFYRVVFRIIEMFNKISRFIFMECGMRLKYMFYETVILFTNITFRKKEAILLKTRWTHILLMKEKSVVWNLWRKINKKTYIECNLCLFIYRTLEKCWMRTVVFAPRFWKAPKILGITIRTFTILQIVTPFSIDIWRIYLVIQ